MDPNLLAPSSELLMLGAGSVFFNRFDASGNPTGMLHLGNVTTFELTTEDDNLDKYQSMTRAKSLYKRVPRRRNVTLNISGDEFSPHNLALILQGEIAQTAAAAGAAVTGEAAGLWKLGAYYKTTQMGPITAVTVNVAGTPAVLGTDYEIADPDFGIIHALPGSAIEEGGAVTLDYTPTAYAGGLTQVRGGTETNVRGSVLFAGDPTVGPKMLVEVWKVTISPNGALGLISEEYATLGLTAAVESDSVNHPTEPLYRVTYLPPA